jgi:hypothetical protein
VLIANSDPYAVILNCQSAAVSVFCHEECWMDQVVDAPSFELFLRGVGTGWLSRGGNGNAVMLAEEVSPDFRYGKALAFWSWFMH